MESSQTIYAIALDPTSLASVETLAAERGLTIASYPSIDAFLRAWRIGGTGCILLDLCAAGEEGLAGLESLRRHNVYLPVVVTADQPTVALAVRAMQQGAASLVEKPLASNGLECALGDALQQEEEHRQARRQREVTIERLASLSEGEREVLQRLMAGMANKNIAADLQLGLRTVELRRAKLLKKLGVKSLAEMVRLVVLADPSHTLNRIPAV